MTAYDFTGLTAGQQTLLTFQGWYVGSVESGYGQPSYKSVAPLIERGLLIEHQRQKNGMTYREYEVPTPVHVAWCAECSRREAKRHARGK